MKDYVWQAVVLYRCEKCGNSATIPKENIDSFMSSIGTRDINKVRIKCKICGGIMHRTVPPKLGIPVYSLLGIDPSTYLSTMYPLVEDDEYDYKNAKKDAPIQEFEDEGKLPRNYTKFNRLRREGKKQRQIAEICRESQAKVNRVLKSGDTYIQTILKGIENRDR